MQARSLRERSGARLCAKKISRMRHCYGKRPPRERYMHEIQSLSVLHNLTRGCTF
jgi:hypothetical protein